MNVTVNGVLVCSCNHLTSFSLLVKPNPIDVKQVVAGIEKVGETRNHTVIATVAVIFLVYFLVIAIVRRADRKDAAKKVSMQRFCWQLPASLL